MLKPMFGIDLSFIPFYQIMLFIAFIAATIKYKKSFSKSFLSKDYRKRLNRSFGLSAVAGLFVANAINWITIDGLINYSLFYRLTHGGFSFYYGLIAFTAVAVLMLRINKIDTRFALNQMASTILTGQLIARIGCCLRGCCYGETVTVFGQELMIPVRGADILFAIIMLMVLNKCKFTKRLNIYIFSYSMFRFMADFFRGGDNGVLFGITSLTPTQFLAIFVLIISGLTLFTRPIFKFLGFENTLDKIKSNLNVFEAMRAKNNPEKAEYKPIPFNFKEPANKKHYFKIAVALILVFAIIFLSFVLINPFNTDWCEDLGDSIKDGISSLFSNKTTENEIGESNGSSVFLLSAQAPIKSSADAVNLVKKCEKLTEISFKEPDPLPLPNGNVVYVMAQTYKDKVIFGKNKALVTDKNNNPLYIAGDSASLSYSTEINDNYAPPSLTVKEAFGDKVKVTNKTNCWYDTGDGLVEAYYGTLSEDGKNPVANALIHKKTDKIINITEPGKTIPSNQAISDINSATDNICNLIKDNKKDEIKEISKENISNVNELEKDSATIEKALCNLYINAEISDELFVKIIKTAAEICNSISSLSFDLYCDVFANETSSTLVGAGLADTEVERAIKLFDKVMKKIRTKGNTDECAVEIIAETSKSSLDYSIDFSGDSDVFSLNSKPNHTTELTFTAETPIQVEISDTEGRSVLSTLVDEEELTVSLYPEDGSDFIVRVTDYNSEEIDKASDYSIEVKAIEESVPKGIETTLKKISDSYNYSLTPIFYSMYMENGELLPFEETIAYSLLAAITDSIASQCGGYGNDVDTGKSLIAAPFVGNIDNHPELLTLKGTEMTLSYVDHVETDDCLAVKAQIQITSNGLDLYSSYTFMRLEDYSLTYGMMTSEEQQFVELLNGIVGESYCVTDINHDYLYEMFGDSKGNISATSDIKSLYDVSETYIDEIGGFEIPLKKINRDKAFDAGHSAEKVDAFEKYIAQSNLATVKQIRSSIKIQQDILKSVRTVGEPIKLFTDWITNPLGAAGDYFFAKNDFTEVLWKGYKIVFDTQGVITDAVVETVFTITDEAAELYTPIIQEFDTAVTEYEVIYNGFD